LKAPRTSPVDRHGRRQTTGTPAVADPQAALGVGQSATNGKRAEKAIRFHCAESFLQIAERAFFVKPAAWALRLDPLSRSLVGVKEHPRKFDPWGERTPLLKPQCPKPLRSASMRVCTVQQMRDMDQAAIGTYGIPEVILMENAGLAAYRVLRERYGDPGGRSLICCGAGNNGGDGFVVARKILSDGGHPVVLLLGDPSRYRGAARSNFEMLDRLGTEVAAFQDRAQVRALVDSADLIVDAIFGTGLSKPVGGHYAEVIEMINASGKPVLSLDIPSGISGDSGRVLGVAVRADATVTFGLPKVGNLLYPGSAYGGECFVSRISFPPALTRAPALTIAVNQPPPLPPRNPAGHKGSFGDVLFIAGAAGYYGAPYLAAMAFLKAGGGYSRLAAPASIVPVIAARGSEIVFHPQAETEAGSLAYSNRDALEARIRQADMLVMGPGLSLDEETARLVGELTETTTIPLLLDGDALTILSASPARHRQTPRPDRSDAPPGRDGPPDRYERRSPSTGSCRPPAAGHPTVPGCRRAQGCRFADRLAGRPDLHQPQRQPRHGDGRRRRCPDRRHCSHVRAGPAL
jgi:hydroxyethylthiazole kinase-like uncharacterized protein yjeF